MSKQSYVTVTDQFCGAGGSSLGAVAGGAEVILAMNHWKLAIETHNTNFPNTHHDCTDISACDPRRYPSTDILITSPECTNHSLAKGKKRKNVGHPDLWGNTGIDPMEERSRATMWDVPRFAEFHQYNVIIVENVVDARKGAIGGCNNSKWHTDPVKWLTKRLGPVGAVFKVAEIEIYLNAVTPPVMKMILERCLETLAG